MKVILQPCGNSVAQKNFVDTIEKKIPVNDIYNDLSEIEQEVVNTFPFQEIAVWGVTAGKNNVNKVDWEKINPNDIALFYKENKFYSQGSILCKFQNKSLAEKIWGAKDDGETWECMYFFKEIKEISIDIKEFNKLLSYGEENKIFKFRVLDENKSNLIIQHFKL